MVGVSGHAQGQGVSELGRLRPAIWASETGAKRQSHDSGSCQEHLSRALEIGICARGRAFRGLLR